jgi:magnesium transporter
MAEGQFETFEDLLQRFDPSMVNWINVDGLYDVELLRKLEQKFSIHPLALEDVLNTAQRPKVEHDTDHYFIISEMIYKEETYGDLATSLMDVYLSSLGFRTNEIMRVLTVTSSIFIPLIFLAGVYGMNFNTECPLNMPELNWPFGYLLCLGVMACIGTGMVIFFKRKNWL